jgi:hypothetical protein
MRKFCTVIACVVLVSLFCAGVLHGIETRIVTLKSDLNIEFGQLADADMFAITVTRTPISPGSAPLISHNEFEQVLKLLYASCVDPGCCLTRWWRGSEAAIPSPYYRNDIVLNDTVDNTIDDAGGLSARTVDAVGSVGQNMGRVFSWKQYARCL